MSNARTDFHPGRLWSLLDMLRIYAEKYIAIGGLIADMRTIFHMTDDALKHGEKDSQHLDEDERAEFRTLLKEMIKVCETLNLSVQHLVSSAYDDPPQTAREFDLLVRAVMAELKGKLFLFVPSHVAKYYEWPCIVSDKVDDAFPKASQEIRRGGSCLAAGLHTAAVFHAKRAAEIGLRSLGAEHQIKIKTGKPLEQAEWREILDGLSGAVSAIENLPNATPTKDADLHFMSEACAQFRFFKGGWRIRVAHARASYNESEATEAIDHVRSFFETLATRLREPL